MDERSLTQVAEETVERVCSLAYAQKRNEYEVATAQMDQGTRDMLAHVLTQIAQSGGTMKPPAWANDISDNCPVGGYDHG